MAGNGIVSIGECMLELSGKGGEDWRMGFAGDTLNTLWALRALTGRTHGQLRLRLRRRSIFPRPDRFLSRPTASASARARSSRARGPASTPSR